MGDPAPPADATDVTLLFTAEDIRRRVEILAGDIASAMANPFTMIILLKGAFVLGADLVRALSRRGRHPRIDFLRLESYGDARETSGRVRLQGPLPRTLAGRTVLLVDDVLDSGLTLVEAVRLIREGGAAGVRTCVLVRKEGKQRVAIDADFVGFTIGDHFVVGYGIDWAERYRDLPYLGAIASKG